MPRRGIGSPSRLELLGAATPMGPPKDSPASPKNQEGGKIRGHRGRRRRQRPRRRNCLLKACERVYRPPQPLTRYCCEACQEQARRWRQWKARRRYRQSPHGKQKRQAQSRRYRQRQKERPVPKPAPLAAARVIPTNLFLCTCDRPGCYGEFDRTRRSPLQRFCSHACRQALARVRQRERRWRERRGAREGWKRVGGTGPLRR